MAALVLSAVGNAVAGPVGGLVGAIVGTAIDRTLLSSSKKAYLTEEGPRLSSLFVTSSSEGAPVLRVIGHERISPQIIWATNFREVVTTTSSTQDGGKGTGSGSSSTTTTTTTYSYFCSFALGLCEGPIIDIGGIWADGKPLDISSYTWRLYKGTESQGPDPKIEAVEGAGNVPAYRGLAYLVFEELPLEKFGNRIPQITVEVFRRPNVAGTGIEDLLTAVTMIPGLGEFVYASDVVYRSDGFGHSIVENKHGSSGKADIVQSLDQLQSAAPNVATVSLVCSWHGTDLRCGNCQIKPKVENAEKVTTPWSWQVGPVTRGTADIVSQDSFGPLLGGSPADRSVYQAVRNIKDRGLRCILYPFINMDIPSGNTLPNPYSNNATGVGQSAFPWRGRITCSPAAGFAGTVDKTATAGTQVDSFFGACAPGDFSWDSVNFVVNYAGPAEWSFRRLILHYATIAAAAGADAILIGSEMVALTTIRSAAGTFPAVAKLAALAADVKSIVGGGCKVGYAADWTEYANYRPSDGSNDLYFHLDPLWSDSHVDFIGVDNYMPLSDWRAGRLHLDAQAGAPSIYDQTYLQSNVEGGELFAWYYASRADRDSQTRTTITDGGYGKPWVFRYKDFRSWWSNLHYNRPGGVETGSPTAWVPESKPIWFTEMGCAAVEKGTNQPNVFIDPKSSESLVPYFSNGRRDDLVQRSYHEALLHYWDPAAGHNPTSGVYGAPMVDRANFCSWTWDARPYPQFPNNTAVWRDGGNWRRGHWLTGRLGLVTLSDTVLEICSGLGVTVDAGGLAGIVRGYVVDNVMSPRSELAPLMQCYFFDAVESSGTIKFVQRGGDVAAILTADGLVDSGDDKGFYQLTRAQETDLPRTAHLQFLDPDNDYQIGDVYARRLKGSSVKTIEVTPALALDAGEAQGIADSLLIDSHVMRERAELTLPPSTYALEPTDVVNLTVNGRTFEMRLEEIGYEHIRPAKMVRTGAGTYGGADGPAPVRPPPPFAEPGPVDFEIMDLPVLSPTEVVGPPRFACYGEPWARCVVYRSPASTGYLLDQLVVNRAILGRVLYDFYSGPVAVWDTVNDLYVQVPSTETLASLDDPQVLAGRNVCAVKNADGQWEVLQFANAVLIALDQYRLSRLLRGQLGSEYAMRDPVSAGARFVFLDANVVQSNIAVTQRGNPWNWKWGPSTKAIDDSSYQTKSFSFDAVGLRPYSPVHLAGTVDASSHDWTLTWIRRTRIDGDNWAAPDVPLGEEIEAYDVEIINPAGGAVVRTARVSEPTFAYTSAMQVADFGSEQTTVKFKAYQISLAYGRGSVATRQVYS